MFQCGSCRWGRFRKTSVFHTGLVHLGLVNPGNAQLSHHAHAHAHAGSDSEQPSCMHMHTLVFGETLPFKGRPSQLPRHSASSATHPVSPDALHECTGQGCAAAADDWVCMTFAWIPQTVFPGPLQSVAA